MAARYISRSCFAVFIKLFRLWLLTKRSSALRQLVSLDRGGEVRRHAHLLQHDVERGVAVESLDLAVPHVEEIRARNVDLRSRWLDHAGGRFHRAAKGSLNGQFNGDDVAHDIYPVKFSVNVGKHLSKGDYDVFQMLASI